MDISLEKVVKVQSPGRINIIGEHTDYNDGFVLPVAIDRETTFEIWQSKAGDKCKVTAKDFNESHTFRLSELSPLASGWQNYVIGVVAELIKEGCTLRGFQASFSGNVPVGSGMSSSAALECALVKGLDAFFDLGLSTWQLIKIAQRAEHNFVGMKCGIMDQFASMLGKKDQAMLLDCRSLEYEYFPLDLAPYTFLLIDSNVQHQLATSEYNTRRSECEHGVEIIQKEFEQIKNLRDVSMAILNASRDRMDPVIFRRCQHVVGENERVIRATKAMHAGDLKTLGSLIYASHFSLRTAYEISCQEIDFLVDFTQDKSYVLGSRIMGGGFGGCSVNLIHEEHVPRFVEEISDAYQEKFGFTPQAHCVSAADGTSILLSQHGKTF